MQKIQPPAHVKKLITELETRYSVDHGIDNLFYIVTVETGLPWPGPNQPDAEKISIIFEDDETKTPNTELTLATITAPHSTAEIRRILEPTPDITLDFTDPQSQIGIIAQIVKHIQRLKTALAVIVPSSITDVLDKQNRMLNSVDVEILIGHPEEWGNYLQQFTELAEAANSLAKEILPSGLQNAEPALVPFGFPVSARGVASGSIPPLDPPWAGHPPQSGGMHGRNGTIDDYLEKLCDQIDATVFTSDYFIGDAKRVTKMRKMIARWERELAGHNVLEAENDET